MAYKIGSCTLVANFVLGGSAQAVQGNDADANASSCAAGMSGDVGGAGGSISLSYSGFNPDNPHNADPTATNVTVTASAGTDTQTVEYQSVDSIDLTGTISGAVPCDVVWEYVVEGSNPFFNGIVDSPYKMKRRYFLIGNGDAAHSASCAGASASSTTDVRGREISPDVTFGADVSAAAAIGVMYDEAHPTGYGVLAAEASASASISCETNVPAGPASASSASASDTQAIPDSSESISYSSSAFCSSGGASASTTNGPGASGGCGYSACRSYSIDAILRAMESAYPDSLTISTPVGPVTATGSFSVSDIQVSYSTSASADAGSVNDHHTNGQQSFGDVSVSIPQESLESVGDEPYAQRLMFRGEVCPGLSITQAESFTIDDMADESGGVLTVVGGAAGTRSYATAKSFSSYRYLRVRLRSVGSADQPATITIGGYGWNLTTGADGTFVERDIDLCSPDTVTTDALNDAWDTRWPIPTGTSVTSGPFRVDSVTFTNVPSGKTVEIDSLTLVRVNPPTLDFLPTLYHAKYFTPPDPADPYVEPEWPDVAIQNEERSFGTGGDGISNDWVRRFLLANSDGRQTVEETDFWYTRSVNAVSGITVYSFNMPSLSGLASQINDNGDLPFYAPWNLGTDPAGGQPRWPGWTATPALTAPADFVPSFTGEAPPANPYFYNADVQQASFLFGGGALYQDGWTFGFDRATDAGFPSQPLFDIIELCGMAGDVFGHGGGSIGSTGVGDAPASCSLKAAAILRAQSHGLVFNSDTGDPVDGQAVELRQDGSLGTSTVGTGTSRTDGWYHTAGSSALPPGGSVSVRPIGGDSLILPTVYTRHRQRGTFIFVPPPSPSRNPRGLNTRQGGFYAVVVVEGGKKAGRVRFRRTKGEQVPRFVSWHVNVFVSTPGTNEGDAEPWVWYGDKDGSLHVLYTRGTYDPADTDPNALPTATAVREAVSFDDGATWTDTEVTTVARHPQAMVEPGSTGGTLRAWFVPVGTGDPQTGRIDATFQAAGDASPSAVFTFQYDSSGLTDMVVQDDVFGLTYAYESQGRYNLVVLFDSDDTPSDFHSSDDGRTWTRVT